MEVEVRLGSWSFVIDVLADDRVDLWVNWTPGQYDAVVAALQVALNRLRQDQHRVIGGDDL